MAATWQSGSTTAENAPWGQQQLAQGNALGKGQQGNGALKGYGQASLLGNEGKSFISLRFKGAALTGRS